MNHKITALTVALAILLLPLASATSSYELWCLSSSESVDFGELCNPLMPSMYGPVNICVRLLDSGAICPANMNICNSLELSCEASSSEIDETAPEITLNSPSEESVFTSRSVPLDVELTERASVYYKDNLDSRERWKTVCTNCAQYHNDRSFSEGVNDLTFKAIDDSGNEAFETTTFYIDSKEPRISSVETGEFSSGFFSIEFDEETPETVELNYGNPTTGFQTYQFNIETECFKDRKYECSTNLNLEEYDGQEIQFSATVIDIAGNSATSRAEQASVDYTAPSLIDSTVTIDGRYATFVLEIDEPNFDEASYIDNSDSRPKWKKLCSRLGGSICEKRVSFGDGNHDIQIQITDKAGLSTQTSFEFFTDSKSPRIKRVEPRRDFASGEFSIQFEEQNPETLLLKFGNDETGFQQTSVSIDEECTQDRYYNCDSSADLEDYDGQEIEFEFILTDRVGQTAEKQIDGLLVDLTIPVINSISHELDRTRAEITIDVTEQNLDEILYVNSADRRPRERRFCSRLDDGICEKRINLQEGTNELNFTVYDEAGNSITQNYQISL